MIDHTLRSQSIGGSEIAAMLGLCPYQSSHDLWLSKTGRAKPFEGNEHTRRGKALEPALIELLGYELTPQGFKIEPWDKTIGREIEGRMRYGSPDAFVTHPETSDGGAEIKTFAGYLSDIQQVEERKISWILQSQHYMNLTERGWWILAWMDSSFQLRVEWLQADPEMQAMIIREMDIWWDTYIVGDTPPPFDRPSDLVKLATNGNYKQATAETYQLVEQLKAKKAELQALQSEVDQMTDIVKLCIGQHDGLTYAGRKIASWKMGKNNRTFRL